MTVSRWARNGQLTGARQDMTSGIWYIPERAINAALEKCRKQAQSRVR